MLTTYIPVITAFVVALITVYGNYKVGQLKSNIDSKTITVNAGDALRDDLLNLIDKYEKREFLLLEKMSKYDEQNQKLQETVTGLRDEILTLRSENRQLTSELQRTRAELEAFERKVYYIPSKKQE